MALILVVLLMNGKPQVHEKMLFSMLFLFGDMKRLSIPRRVGSKVMSGIPKQINLLCLVSPTGLVIGQTSM